MSPSKAYYTVVYWSRILSLPLYYILLVVDIALHQNKRPPGRTQAAKVHLITTVAGGRECMLESVGKPNDLLYSGKFSHGASLRVFRG